MEPAKGVAYPITMGASFGDAGAPADEYTLLRYDFKPASVSAVGQGELEVQAATQQVSLTLPSANGGGVRFRGRAEPSRDGLDCVAIFDGTGFRLERLAGAVHGLRHVPQRGVPAQARPAAAPPAATARAAEAQHLESEGLEAELLSELARDPTAEEKAAAAQAPAAPPRAPAATVTAAPAGPAGAAVAPAASAPPPLQAAPPAAKPAPRPAAPAPALPHLESMTDLDLEFFGGVAGVAAGVAAQQGSAEEEEEEEEEEEDEEERGSKGSGGQAQEPAASAMEEEGGDEFI